MFNEDLVEYSVEFEVRETMTYRVFAKNEDEAIEKAQADADLDYNGDAEFLNIWEV